MCTENEENILYEKWRSALENERGEILQELFRAVGSHAQAVVVTNFMQEVPELEADIASDVRKEGNGSRPTGTHRHCVAREYEDKRAAGGVS